MATNDKYDRQLRLWGASGQRALAETCVVLVRATAAGTETCKNLVLPGIGALQIVDDHPISSEYKSNFFLTNDDPTKSRAQCALEHLVELNPDVQGSWKHVSDLKAFDLAGFLASIPSSYEGIRKLIVVASDLEPGLLRGVAAVCETAHIPVIAVHSYGLVGLVRLQAPPLPLLDPKPRDTVPDLRLMRPFTELQSLADAIAWDALPDHEHGHIPYPYILLHAMKLWKSSHNQSAPKTFAEKQEFQTSIRSLARNYENQLNFQEAVNNAYTAYTEREIDWERLNALTSSLPSTNPICALVNALQQFCNSPDHRSTGPLHGSIPDMTASTDHYVHLQAAYRRQADSDREALKGLLAFPVDDETISLFCQNVHTLDVFIPRTIREEYDVSPDAELCEDLAMSTMEGDERPDHIALLWYLAWRACQDFCIQHQRFPGTGVSDYQKDIPLVQQYVEKVVTWYKLETNDLIQSTLLDKTKMSYAEEMVRYGAAEVHNIASIVGGVASQEAVKIVTGQYTPLNYLYVYNGIASTAGVYKV